MLYFLILFRRITFEALDEIKQCLHKGQQQNGKQINLIVLGDSGSGKTTLLNQLNDDFTAIDFIYCHHINCKILIGTH
jgi:septin family protein